MASLEELRNERIKKMDLLREKGINPYPATTNRTDLISDIVNNFKKYEGKNVTIDGRIMGLRKHGGSTFFDVFDGSEKIQGLLKQDEIKEESYSLFDETIDRGDFIEISGEVFNTKRGEKSILVKEWKILTKSLRPIPDDFYGFKDDEERLRKRYLDILLNEEVRDMVIRKADFWKSVRNFMESNKFIEVQTPTLEMTTGGAEARPFKTHHNDYDIDMFLRISVGELWQKRLMATGIPNTYEIGRVYRNEGSSPDHLQEFTNMEFYSAFMNFDDGKNLVKSLFQTIAKDVFKTTKFSTRGHDFDLDGEWEDLDYVKTIEEKTDINVLEASIADIKSKLQELGVKYDGENRERLSDSLWKYCRKQISGPAFLVNHPKLVAPLSKVHPDDERLTKTFQVIIAGSELGRAHAELNDPIDQKDRFDVQQKLIKEGDGEAMMQDDEFVEMLEYGIPPTFGFGMGERFFSFLMDKPIRETQIFPLMKTKQ